MQTNQINLSTDSTMNNSQLTKKPQIHIKRVYPYDIQKIWAALTTKEALSSWLMETTDFALALNQSFQLKTKPQGNFDGIVNCKILAFNQPHSITYSWRANSMKKPTIVTWKLSKISDQETLLTLAHSGFEGFNGWITKQILSFGWKGLLRKNLVKYLLA